MSLLKGIRRYLLLAHTSSSKRFWEIDALRGVAIVMMVTYHAAYDLAFLGYYQANVLIGPWRAFARVTAGLFILLVGGSMALSHARTSHHISGWSAYRVYLARGTKLLGWGMLITLVTWVYMGKPVIIFGILHLIGATTALAYPFISLRAANLVLGAGIMALGVYLNQLPVTHPWLLPMGLRPRTLVQLDYFPLLPWFGLALLGVFIGQQLYPDGRRRLSLPDLAGWPGIRELVWLGERSLSIYLLHQPVLFAILSLANALIVGSALVNEVFQ